VGLVFFLVSAIIAAALSVVGLRAVHPGRIRSILYLVAGLGALPVLVCLGATSAYAANEWRLARFGAQLLDAPLPRDTRETSRSSAVGVLTGNGDHCDFVVTRRLDSALPIDSLRAHFANIHLRPAIAGGADGGLPAIDIRVDSVRHFTITATDAAYYGTFDPRCF